MKKTFLKWPLIQLDTLAKSIDYGLTVSASDKNIGPKFLRITDIQDGGVDWEKVPFCQCDDEDRKKYELASGDIVFARTGATTGKSFLIRECPIGSVFASYLIRVKPNSLVDPTYLYRFFQTPEYWQQITSRSTGTAQAGVNATKLKSILLPLPPLAEQQRIAAILDKADALREKRRRTIAKLDELQKSVFLEMFGDPVTNPKKYKEATIGQITKLISSGVTPLGGSSTYVKEGILFIRSQNVLMNNFDLSDVAFITDETHNKMKRTWVKNGDVLFNITGASIGRVHFFTGLDDSANVNQHVCIIRPDTEKIKSEFLSYFLSFPSYQANIISKNAGATRQAFNFQQIRDFQIFLPEKKEQEMFVQRQKLIQLIKTKSENSLVKLNALFFSLQQRAFSGELFEQNEVERVIEKEMGQLSLFSLLE